MSTVGLFDGRGCVSKRRHVPNKVSSDLLSRNETIKMTIIFAILHFQKHGKARDTKYAFACLLAWMVKTLRTEF